MLWSGKSSVSQFSILAPEHPYIPHIHISPACSNNHLSSLSCFLHILAAARPHETLKTLFPQLLHNICTDKTGYQKSSIEAAAFAVCLHWWMAGTDNWAHTAQALSNHTAWKIQAWLTILSHTTPATSLRQKLPHKNWFKMTYTKLIIFQPEGEKADFTAMLELGPISTFPFYGSSMTLNWNITYFSKIMINV